MFYWTSKGRCRVVSLGLRDRGHCGSHKFRDGFQRLDEVTKKRQRRPSNAERLRRRNQQLRLRRSGRRVRTASQAGVLKDSETTLARERERQAKLQQVQVRTPRGHCA